MKTNDFLRGGEILCEEGRIRIRGSYAVPDGDMMSLEIKDTILEELDNDLTFSEDIRNRITDYIRYYQAARLSITVYVVHEDHICPCHRAWYAYKNNILQQDENDNPYQRSRPDPDSLIRNFLKSAAAIPLTALLREPVVLS